MNKTLIVGIDFSDCSINALEHAISIAQKAKAGITMVWVNHLDYSKEIFSVEPKQLTTEVEHKFEELLDKYTVKLHGFPLKYELRKGKVYKEICAVADKLEAFLTVIGTHGSTGFEEFWIGSNANRMVSSSKRPIITIRGGVDSGRDLRTIVMPFDSTKVTRQKLPFTTLLAKYFDSEVHVLGIFTSTLDDIRYRIRNYVAQAEDYLTENGIRHKTEFLEVDNITDGTLEYAKKVDANLISIMTEQETRTSNLWLGPFAAQMVNHSPIPVLSIHPDKYKFYNG
ncbi:MAG: universal stress protein [Bacteroidales bacterium]|nr:universal stress protein [Bacteroidales bacterium]MCF6341326.1 universal stress protein [Bacteroidales bacterium]